MSLFQKVKIRRSLPVPLLIAGIIALFTCEESLPTYADPRDLLALTGMTAEVTGFQRSFLTVHIKGVNRYDDTLQDTARVNGSLRVWFPSHDQWRIILPINNKNIEDPTQYNGLLLTLEPGDTFHLQISWNLVAEDSTDILPQIPVDYTGERSGVHYSEPELVNCQAAFSLFEQAGYLESDILEYEFAGFWKEALSKR